jgi:hypothetical protein
MRTLADVPIGQSCRISQLNGVWKVIEDAVDTVKVEQNGTGLELRLSKDTPLKK